MSKIKSIQKLEDFIDNEMQWRRKEICDLKIILKDKKKSIESSVLSKSLILVSYSHWEGFVKGISRKYLEYVKFLGLKGNKLSSALSSAVLFHDLCKNQLSTFDKIERIFKVLTSESHIHNIDPDGMSDAKSNLNFEVLRIIIRNLGTSTDVFETESIYLDSVILKNRNDFAHGDTRFVEPSTAIEIADKCISLMTTYKNLVENLIAQNSFKQKA